jgi:hypothetical protein
MLGFQGGVSIPLVKGGVKAPPAKRQCRAAPKAWLDAALPPALSIEGNDLHAGLGPLGIAVVVE